MLTTLFQDLVDDDAGATAIEYGLIATLIALAIIASVQALAGETIEMFNGVEAKVSAANDDNS